MINNIAILLTCHNRKEKTLSCLASLYSAFNKINYNIKINVYLTDDGSIDGTKEAVKAIYPEINILKGTGSLFWAGGMRNSWNEALKKRYDAYLLLNDDTNVTTELFNEMYKAHEYSINHFSCAGIYIGATIDPVSKSITYSCWKLLSKIFNTYTQLLPNGNYQLCSFGNGNIMLVTANVIDKIGIFYKNYIHGIADFDYTLTATKNKIPVILLPNAVGECAENKTDVYKIFRKLNFVKRWKYLNNPVGLGYKDQIIYMRRHFPLRVPFVFIASIIKVISPSAYLYFHKLR